MTHSIFPRPLKHVLAFAILGGCMTMAGAHVVESFSTRPETTAEREVTVSIGAAPKSNDGSVLRMGWQKHEGKHIAGHVKAAAPLIDKPGKYIVTARACLEMLGPECRRLALRVADRSREVHQYTVDIVPGEPGWVDVSWVIDTENPEAGGASRPWGGDGNGALDLPVYLRGFALPFNKAKTTGGELWIDEVSIKPFEG